jgi:hypothetical protein
MAPGGPMFYRPWVTAMWARKGPIPLGMVQ